MKITQNNIKKKEESVYNITAKGSLGVLAFGDVGLRAWRKVKQNVSKNN